MELFLWGFAAGTTLSFGIVALIRGMWLMRGGWNAARAEDEARRRRIISEACDRSFGPDGAARRR
jgi:hypothetical protein